MTEPSDTPNDLPVPALLTRSVTGGVLMGLANLVPGISGGTMLLAAGIYPRFVNAVADVTTLRIRRQSVLLLIAVVGSAAAAVLLLAGVVKDLVVEHRWVMYSLFIGLTLGGVPVVWRLARPVTPGVYAGAGCGFVAMALLALAQQSGAGTSASSDPNVLLYALAGLAGASAMILPGVSGGYLLLVLGMYIPILSGVDAFKSALAARDGGTILSSALGFVVPLGAGVVLGVVAVASVLRWLLARFAKPTLGVLLGLLLGAVVGLWPFQRPVEPVPGETIVKGRIVTTQTLAELDVEDYPTERFTPSAGQVAGSLALILGGGMVTLLVARFGRDES